MPVRVGPFERYMERFRGQQNAEIGAKSAMLLSEFYKLKLDPRYRRLERLPWNRFGLWVLKGWDWAALFIPERAVMIWNRVRGRRSAGPPATAEPPSPDAPAAGEPL